jgi:hypothetical protein
MSGRVGGAGPGGAFFFDRGLVGPPSIADQPRLPEAPDLPAEGTELPQQIELLYPRNPLDALLEDAMRPDLEDRAVLAPAVFDAALEDAPFALAEMVRRLGPAARSIAEDAAAVLDGILADRALLDAARRALTRA